MVLYSKRPMKEIEKIVSFFVHIDPTRAVGYKRKIIINRFSNVKTTFSILTVKYDILSR